MSYKVSKSSCDDFSFSLAFLFLSFPFYLSVVAAASYYFNVGVHAALFWIALFFSILTVYFFSQTSKLSSVWSVVGGILVVALSIYVSSVYIDMWWDARAYHRPAVIYLLEGWNPILDSQNSTITSQLLQIGCYPKASWYISSLAAVSLGSIESGKFINLILILSLLIFSWQAFKSVCKINSALSMLYALVVAFNPISLMQWQTLYNDGVGYSLLGIQIFCWILYIKTSGKKYLCSILFALVLASNLKYGLLIYSGLFSVFFMTVYIFKKRLYKEMVAFAALALVLVLFVGCNPYITNTIWRGSPLYPFMKGLSISTSKMTKVNLPEELKGYNRFGKFFKGALALPGWTYRSPLLIFSNGLKEIMQYPPNLQVILGGWGPLFWAILPISLCMLIFVRSSEIIIALIVVLISMFAHDGAWFVRYTPQTWLIPGLAVAGLGARRNTYITAISVVIAVIMLINSFIVVFEGVYQYDFKRIKEFNSIIFAVKNDGSNVVTPDIMDRIMPYPLQKYAKNPTYKEPCLPGDNICICRSNMIMTETWRLKEYGISVSETGKTSLQTLKRIDDIYSSLSFTDLASPFFQGFPKAPAEAPVLLDFEGGLNLPQK